MVIASGPPDDVAQTSSGLVIRVMGGLDVRVDGRPVDVRGDLRRRLLLALLAARERPNRPERLAQLVWADDREHGANAVQAHISRLRRVLDPSGDRGTSWVQVRPDGYVLRPDHVDVFELERAISAAESALVTSPAQAQVRLARVLSECAPIVEDDVASWQQLRDRLELRILGAQDSWADLAARHGDSRDVDRIVEFARAEPTREVRWMLAMRGLVRTGRPADALELFLEARRRLREDFGLDPSRELRQTHAAVLRQDPELAGPDPQPDPAPGHTTMGPRVPPRPVTTFVGRTEELAQLESALLTSRVVTITGIGGVGKSRLMTEWIGRSGRTGACHWVDLRDASRSDVPARIADELGVVDEEGDPVGAITAALGSLPVTLAIDNAESVADESAAVIVALTGALPQLSVVTASRVPLGVPGERVLTLPPLVVDAAFPRVDPRGSRDEQIGSSSGSGSNSSASPDLLDTGEGTAFALAAARLGPDATDAEIRGVARRSGGLPLAIELLAAGAASLSPAVATNAPAPTSPTPTSLVPTGLDATPGLDSMPDATPAPMPDHTPDVTQQLTAIAAAAVESLPPDSARLFSVMLDLPAGAGPDLLAHLADRVGATPARRSRLLRDLVGSSLVLTVPTASANARLVLRHRVLQPIADLADRWRSADMMTQNHAMIAEWVTSHLRSDWTEPNDSRRLSALLGETAAIESLMRWYAEHQPDALLPLANRISHFWLWSGRSDLCRDWVQRGLDAQPDRDTPTARRERAIAILTMSQGRGLGHLALALDGIDEAIALLTSPGVTDPSALAVAYGLRAVALGWRGDLDGVSRSLELARQAAPTPPEARWLHMQFDLAEGLSQVMRANPARGLAEVTALAHEFITMGAPDDATIAMHFALYLATYAAPDDIPDLLEQSEAMAAQAQPHLKALIAGDRARHALSIDSLDAARALHDAVSRTERTGNLRTASIGRRDLGLLYLRRGELGPARAELVRAARHLVRQDTTTGSLALAGLARMAALEGSSAASAQYARAAHSLAAAPSAHHLTDLEEDLLEEYAGPAPTVQLEREDAIALALRLLDLPPGVPDGGEPDPSVPEAAVQLEQG